PTDAAFDAFFNEHDTYNSIDDVPTDVLAELLLNHVISEELTAADLTAAVSGYRSTNATGAGDNAMSIYFDASGGVLFNNVATVTTPDVTASNGVIHIVDAVIDLPDLVDHAVANPNLSDLVAALTEGGNTVFTDLLSTPGDYTVFAPNNTAFTGFTNPNNNDINDILSNHVILGATAVSGGLTDGYVNTAALYNNNDGEYLSLYVDTSDGVTLNGTVTVSTADVIATNGVIHVVDEVIDIPTVVTFAVADPNLSSLATALTREDQPDFVATLSASNGGGNDPFTIFAPDNAAFQALLDTDNAWETLNDIETNLLTSVLEHHVISAQNVRAGALTDGAVVATLEGDNITITLPGNDGNPASITDGTGNSDIDIIAVDVQAGNGVIHVIESVLLPDTGN
ncbi:MAG: fasciclin domain-containing protein, partial [Bacteroidota bacterium]